LPALKIIDKEKKIICGDIVTIHPLLNHQRVLDGHFVGSSTRDVEYNFEFGRSSTQNIIPNKTTTIKACSFVDSKFNHELISSNSLRVPTDTVGAINVTLFVEKSCIKDEIIEIFNEYEKNQKFDILLNNYDPLVSSDFKKEQKTTIIDHRYTDVKNGKMIKLLVWYDNEWGYASKVTDIMKYYSNN
jgi:glyceraldehyde 3-phosphate dehydrogenase